MAEGPLCESARKCSQCRQQRHKAVAGGFFDPAECDCKRETGKDREDQKAENHAERIALHDHSVLFGTEEMARVARFELAAPGFGSQWQCPYALTRVKQPRRAAGILLPGTSEYRDPNYAAKASSKSGATLLLALIVLRCSLADGDRFNKRSSLMKQAH